jgi:hypothetical protein
MDSRDRATNPFRCRKIQAAATNKDSRSTRTEENKKKTGLKAKKEQEEKENEYNSRTA